MDKSNFSKVTVSNEEEMAKGYAFKDLDNGVVFRIGHKIFFKASPTGQYQIFPFSSSPFWIVGVTASLETVHPVKVTVEI